MDNELLSLIANFGFPALLCMYLLIRVEGKLDKLSAAIIELNKTISLLAHQEQKK